jgi:hypothetical protein
LYQAREKFGDGLRLFGAALDNIDELQERIEAAVAITGADLRCAGVWPPCARSQKTP